MSASIPPDQRPATTTSALPTPTFGPGGGHSITCSTTIRAPLAIVLAALVDTASYPTWNAFCPRVAIDAQPTPFASEPPPSLLAALPLLVDQPSTLRLGTGCTFDVHFQPGQATRSATASVRVSVLEEFRREDDGRRGVRLAWCTARGWTPLFVLRCERIQELVEGPGGDVVEYTCWETFYGLLASTVRFAVGSALEWGLGAWMDGLKEYAEKKHADAE